ncbi:MAG TPA: sigma-70 family RNA polymerase sigma factor [Candidatus Polarisedimenticolaceae bacterium]|nr:sigma-70 family RNA polymerase sigma factor [Candidatus Polarisedimenticolaceae bacterium]
MDVYFRSVSAAVLPAVVTGGRPRMNERDRYRELSRASDDQLVSNARRALGPARAVCLETLYRRFYPRVARWCVKVSRDREEAADLAQEVFLRVHSRFDTFRGDCAFSTWLYTVMRSVAINRGLTLKRIADRTGPASAIDEAADGGRDPAQHVERDERMRRLRRLIDSRLEPLEARVLYLHYVDGMSLPAITRLLGLANKSGAKAFVVSGKRKPRRGLTEEDRGPRALLRVSS